MDEKKMTYIRLADGTFDRLIQELQILQQEEFKGIKLWKLEKLMNYCSDMLFLLVDVND